MTETVFQVIERALASADAASTAQVAFAAIVRIGELGRDAGVELQKLVPQSAEDEFVQEWGEGISLALEADNGELAA